MPSTPTIWPTSATRRFISSWGTQSFSMAKAMSSATDSPTNWVSESCRTVPTLMLRSKMFILAVSWPSNSSFPSIFPLKAKGINPLMQWASVLFPLPLGPTIRTFSCLRISRLMSYRVGSAWA